MKNLTWKQKKFVKSVSTQTCLVCKAKTKSVASHLRQHELTPEKYYIEYSGVKRKVCSLDSCRNKTHFVNLKTGFYEVCSRACSVRYRSQKSSLSVKDCVSHVRKNRNNRCNYDSYLSRFECMVCGDRKESVHQLAGHVQAVHDVKAHAYYIMWSGRFKKGSFPKLVCKLESCNKKAGKFSILGKRHEFCSTHCKVVHNTEIIHQDNSGKYECVKASKKNFSIFKKSIEDFECLVCNKASLSLKSFASHIRLSHAISAADYYRIFSGKRNPGVCRLPGCVNVTSFRDGYARGFKKFCCNQHLVDANKIKLNEDNSKLFTSPIKNKGKRRKEFKKSIEESRCLMPKCVWESEFHEKDSKSLYAHIRWEHKISSEDYWLIFSGKKKNTLCKYKKDFGKCFGAGVTIFFRLKGGYGKFCSSKCSAQHPVTRDMCKETCGDKYGVENPARDLRVRKKISKKLRSREVQGKYKATCMKNHGVESPMQNRSILESALKASAKRKKYVFEDGWYTYCQGYEPFAYSLLENQGLCGYILDNVSSFPYKSKGKRRIYHPDIELEMAHGPNKIIEVKSRYTFNVNKKVNRAKRDAVLAAGLKYELWIFNGEGKRTSILK